MRWFSCGMGDGKDLDGCRPFCSNVNYSQNTRKSGTGQRERTARYLVLSMCSGLWPRGLEPRWHSRVICWMFNLFCLLPRPARRYFSSSFPREVISLYRARSQVNEIESRFRISAAANLRFSIHDYQQKSCPISHHLRKIWKGRRLIFIPH